MTLQKIRCPSVASKRTEASQFSTITRGCQTVTREGSAGGGSFDTGNV